MSSNSTRSAIAFPASLPKIERDSKNRQDCSRVPPATHKKNQQSQGMIHRSRLSWRCANTTFPTSCAFAPILLLSHQNVERKADPSILAFDIECTKAPLKFPSADVDSIFMISYMVRGRGYLILSKHVVSRDVLDFEYTPKPSYPGPFTIFNEETEEALLQRFFDEYRRHRPQIVVTYNGDFFDWPFLETRARLYGLDVYELGGMECAADDDSHQYRGRASVHLDAFHWVQRDSYLPQGAQGLKAVTKYKLGYDPVEVDPEDMVRLAQERPVHMATYSVSDAVATYYLYGASV